MLTGLEKLCICDNYSPKDSDLSKCTPHYIELEGWDETVRSITRYEKLPRQTQDYIECVEQLTGVRVDMISTGPGREENIVRKAILSK